MQELTRFQAQSRTGPGDVDQLRATCLDNGLLTSTSDGIMPLMPPLTISRDECVELVDRLGRSLRDLHKRKQG